MCGVCLEGSECFHMEVSKFLVFEMQYQNLEVVLTLKGGGGDPSMYR